jgi:hypothetical protein
MSLIQRLRQHLTITGAVSLLLAVAIVADAISMYRASFGRSAQMPSRPLPTLATRPPRINASVIVNAHLFGRSAVTEMQGPEAEKEQALKLTGTIVWEEDASRSLAILGPSEHQTRVFKVGTDTDSQGRLDQVFHDHISLVRDGTSLVLALPWHARRLGNSLPNAALADVADAGSADDPNQPPDASHEMVPASLILSHDTQGRSARMQNESSETLTFRVTSKDSKTGSNSMVEVTIPPKRWSRLTDAGLVVGPKDEVTIESPPYLSRSIVLQ